MRNAKVSKILAASMAATMLLTPATALADDVTDISQAGGEVNGSGDFEGYVDKNVMVHWKAMLTRKFFVSCFQQFKMLTSLLTHKGY